MLSESKRLYDLGFAVHWLKPKSKAPVKGGWSGATRDDWTIVDREYQESYGLGVRLGEPSKLVDGYLAVIDVDMKSPDPKHKREAIAAFDEAFPGLRLKAPYVVTGRGLHVYVRTKTPIKSGKVKTSPVQVRVLSPSSPTNKRQDALLSPDDIARGYRMKNAWEVEFMSIGKQVVLPPTCHPDTGKAYAWKRPIKSIEDLPFVEWGTGALKSEQSNEKLTTQNFRAVAVDLVSSPLSDRIVAMVLTGDEVEDRSAACLSVSIAMLGAGFSDQDVMSVLTDRATFLGETAYDHRQTSSRASAAAWVRDYCIVKAREMLRADRAFEDECQVAPQLTSDAEIQAQCAELCTSDDWRTGLARGGQNGEGPPKPTLENAVMVLTNAISPSVFRHDSFGYRDSYGCDTPWGGVNGQPITDADIARMIFWFAKHFRFEPKENTLHNAIAVITGENTFHPVRDQLDALPEWDGVGRLDSWLRTYFEAEGCQEYLAQVFRKWMVAAVARVYRPGTKFDWMIIFEGAQGVGKSSFGRLLVGDQWFSDWLPDLHDKDAALGLQGMWGVEMAELATMRKNEIELVKGFVTRTIDKVRPPYGRRVMEVPRQCVFFGTTNHDEYLQDSTGNRRFKPVKVGQLDFESLARDRDQLWAEARFIYLNQLEPTLELEGRAKTFEAEIHKEKMVRSDSDIMKEEIWEKFEARKPLENEDGFSSNFDFSKFRMKDLFMSGAPLEKWKSDARNHKFAGRALKELGAKYARMFSGRYWRLENGRFGARSD